MRAGVLIVGERDGDSLAGSSRELAAIGADLAGADGEVALVLLGHSLEPCAAAAHDVPVDRLYLIDDQRLRWPNSELIVGALADLVRELAASIILFSHNYFGAEIGPQLAGRLDVPVLGNCLRVARDGEGGTALRPLYGGTFTEEVSFSVSDPVLITLSPGAVGAPAVPVSRRRPAAPIVVRRPAGDYSPRTQLVSVEMPESTGSDISSAKVVVSIGSGIGDPKHLPKIEALAAALGGVVACSRPLADLGWMPNERIVGLSGKTIRPTVYLALGISGAAQHLAGMLEASCIIAVNKDENAPIMRVAHHAVVADLFELVPKLTEIAKAEHAQGDPPTRRESSEAIRREMGS